MTFDASLQKRLALVGGAAGFIGCLMYGIRNAPIPALPSQLMFMFSGPVLLVAYVGIFPFMARPRLTVAAILGTVFGAAGAVVHMAFAVVQLNNLHYMRGFIRASTDVASRQEWQNILQGVFTVQNGLNWVADFFFDWTIFLWAILMWRHPKFGKLFSITGVIAGSIHFIPKLLTFPVPPAEAGLLDGGPAIGIWYAVVSLWVVRHAGWLTQRDAGLQELDPAFSTGSER